MLKIVLHCSDSSFGNAALIDSWHRARGWTRIGYARVFLNGRTDAGFFYDPRLDGLMETGRPIGVTGAHTIGHNEKTGICLIGKSGQFTPRQIEALVEELHNLKIEHGGIEVTQHSDHDPNKPYCAGLSKELMRYFNSI